MAAVEAAQTCGQCGEGARLDLVRDLDTVRQALLLPIHPPDSILDPTMPHPDGPGSDAMIDLARWDRLPSSLHATWSATLRRH